jgi:hypothetical protein
MPKIRLYLQKNDLTKNAKLPYFTLKIVPEEGAEDQEWKEVGVFWKSKSGVGYTGFFSEGMAVDTSKIKARPRADKPEEPKTD